MRLYQHLFYDSSRGELGSARQFVHCMVQAERALVQAQAYAGMIPPEHANAIEEFFDRFEVDLPALERAIPNSGNAAAPLVKQLHAALKAQNTDAAKYIHLGATSQDIVDTARVLQWRNLLLAQQTPVEAIIQSLRNLCIRYRDTPMMGRTLMQHARPITFGLKVAYWMQGIRQVRNLRAALEQQILIIQLGGAVGSQNRYLTREVQEKFAQRLGLRYAPAWHTNRMSIASLSGYLGGLMGNLAKIAQDIILMAQTEVAELAEPVSPGRGTSSTMPHKRNPILAISIAASAKQAPHLVASLLAAMAHEHERAAGNWHAEWEPLDRLLELCAGALQRADKLLAGLRVNPERMRANIDASQGLVFAETVALALAPICGKAAGYEQVKRACEQAQSSRCHLLEVLQNAELPLSNKELAACFEVENSIGLSLEIVDEVLAST